MGRLPTGQRQYEVQHMWQRHHEIARLAVLGLSNKDIAIKLGVTPQTVSNTLNSHIVKHKLQALREARDDASVDVQAVIKDMQGDALGVIGEFLDPEKNANVQDNIKLRAAMDMLDRGGNAAPKVIKSEHLHAHLTGDDIQAIKDRARAQAEDSGMLVIEGEVVND